MNARRLRVCRIFIALLGVGVYAPAAPELKSAQNVDEWLRWVIPLPKEITIMQQVERILWR